MGKYSGLWFREKIAKLIETRNLYSGHGKSWDGKKYSLKPKSLSSSVSKAGMVFVFYLKFVRLRDQLTVETRRNLDPCQIDNFVSGLILSLLTDCRLCPAPWPALSISCDPSSQGDKHYKQTNTGRIVSFQGN